MCREHVILFLELTRCCCKPHTLPGAETRCGALQCTAETRVRRPKVSRFGILMTWGRRQLRNSRYRRDSLNSAHPFLPYKERHTFLTRKGTSLYQGEENVFMTGDGESTQRRVCTTDLMKTTLRIHSLPSCTS